MLTMRGATVRQSGEGEQRWFYGGGLHTWKVTSAESGGAFLLFEDHLDRGKVTPLHRHPGSDETFIVTAGEIVLHVDGAEQMVGAGGVATVLRRVPHAFLATAPETRLLCLHTPGGGDDFYRAASCAATPGEPALAVDFDRVRAAAAASPEAIELLGPPPFGS